MPMYKSKFILKTSMQHIIQVCQISASTVTIYIPNLNILENLIIEILLAVRYDFFKLILWVHLKHQISKFETLLITSK